MHKLTTGKAYLNPKLRSLGEFFISQGIMQGLTLLVGFLAVRLLSVPNYAQYAVVYSVLPCFTVLTDAGFSNTLASLVGVRINDSQVIADYIEALRSLRRRLFLICTPVLVVFFALLVARQHWPWPTVAFGEAALTASLWTSGVSSSYGAVLIVRRDRRRYYRIQIVVCALRLIGLIVLWVLHLLSAVSLIAVNLGCLIFSAYQNYRRAKELLGTEGQTSSGLRREIIHLALPNLPGVIFYAFQGQLSLFLISVFGRTSAVAAVGALARLGQIYMLLLLMCPVLVDPYFASLPKYRLKASYISALSLGLVVLVTSVLFAHRWPEALLFFIGPKYASLKGEVVWIVAASGIAYLSGLMWTIHTARRFVYWWSSWLVIAATALAQIVAPVWLNLSTVRGVVILGFWSAVAGALANFATGLAGFKLGPRQLKTAPDDDANSPAVRRAEVYAR